MYSIALVITEEKTPQRHSAILHTKRYDYFVSKTYKNID